MEVWIPDEDEEELTRWAEELDVPREMVLKEVVEIGLRHLQREQAVEAVVEEGKSLEEAAERWNVGPVRLSVELGRRGHRSRGGPPDRGDEGEAEQDGEG